MNDYIPCDYAILDGNGKVKAIIENDDTDNASDEKLKEYAKKLIDNDDK